MTTKNASRLGTYLAKRRHQLGLSQDEVAERAGVRGSTVTRLEHGVIANPMPDTLQRLATALEVSFEELFALIGYTDADRLPDVRPYLRAKYEGLPEAALAEAEAFFTEFEQRHVKKGSRGKRAG